MSELKIDPSLVPNDRRTLLVDGRRYFSKTTQRCTTCTADERYMYLKLVVGDSVSLECPSCDSKLSLPKNQVPEAFGL